MDPVLPVVELVPKPKTNILFVVGGIIILSLGISLGLFFGKNLYSVPLSIPTPSSIVETTPAPTIDPTTNWKTYMDNRFNFSVKYPGDWNTVPFQGKWESGAWLILAYSPDSKTSTIKGEIVGVVEGQSTFFSVSAYDKSQVTVKSLENLALGKSSKKTEQTINQIKGLLIVNEERTNAIEKLFVFEKENYTFVIQFFWPKGKPENEKAFDQILSTFKFLDRNVAQ